MANKDDVVLNVTKVTWADWGGTTLDGTAVPSDVLKGATFLSLNSEELQTGTLELLGTADASSVLSGKTFYNTNANALQTGTMTNNGGVFVQLDAGSTYTIPAGYHNGKGHIQVNCATKYLTSKVYTYTVSTTTTVTIPSISYTNTSASTIMVLIYEFGETSTSFTDPPRYTGDSPNITGAVTAGGTSTSAPGGWLRVAAIKPNQTMVISSHSWKIFPSSIGTTTSSSTSDVSWCIRQLGVFNIL